MIELLQKERYNTSWCLACIGQCGTQDKDTCAMCRGFVTTYHKCPICNKVDHFFGYDMPNRCECGFVWPDIIELKSTTSYRINYHLTEES